jgi:hypothetical protein
MFLEILTFSILVAVLIVKYGTSAHVARLNQEYGELETIYNRNQHRYYVMLDRKASIEAEPGTVERSKLEVERELAEIRGALEGQASRNRDLEERIESMVN